MQFWFEYYKECDTWGMNFVLADDQKVQAVGRTVFRTRSDWQRSEKFVENMILAGWIPVALSHHWELQLSMVALSDSGLHEIEALWQSAYTSMVAVRPSTSMEMMIKQYFGTQSTGFSWDKLENAQDAV